MIKKELNSVIVGTKTVTRWRPFCRIAQPVHLTNGSDGTHLFVMRGHGPQVSPRTCDPSRATALMLEMLGTDNFTLG